jgi:hypothetical protein
MDFTPMRPAGRCTGEQPPDDHADAMAASGAIEAGPWHGENVVRELGL